MSLLTKLTKLAQKETASGFVRRVPGIYLLVKIPVSHALGFSTRVGAPSNLDLVKALRSGGKEQTSGDFLLRVKKSDRNTWKSRISLGRAPNNDLVVRHDSVSKLHAHFFVRAGASGDPSHEKLVLCDVGSANGTLVNGRTVDEGEGQAATVAAGDRIFFGEVECDLLDAAALHTKLRRLGFQSDF